MTPFLHLPIASLKRIFLRPGNQWNYHPGSNEDGKIVWDKYGQIESIDGVYVHFRSNRIPFTEDDLRVSLSMKQWKTIQGMLIKPKISPGPVLSNHGHEQKPKPRATPLQVAPSRAKISRGKI